MVGGVSGEAPAFDKPRGRMPVLQFLQPEELAIDPSYQRSIAGTDSQRLIRAIAKRWNWDLCLPLVVSRRADGNLYVIDGQHRLEAARLRTDIAHLPCVVGNYSDAAAEAANFVHLNQRRRPLTGLDLFKAAVASGDSEANDIAQAIADADLTLAPHLTAVGWKPGMIGHIGGVKQAWKASQHVAREALQFLATAYAGEVLRYAGTIWPGIVSLCTGHCGADRPFERQAFAAATARLTKYTQRRLRSDIMVLSAGDTMSRTEAAVEAVKAVVAGRRPIDSTQSDRSPQPLPAARKSDGAVDRFDLRTKAGAEFCEQCDRLCLPNEVASCTSKWCGLRDAAA